MPSSVHSDDCYYQQNVSRQSSMVDVRKVAVPEDPRGRSDWEDEDEDEVRPAPGCCGKLFPAGYKQELKATLNIAYGMVVIFICNVSMQPIAVMFGGHLGALQLDAVAMAGMLINVLGNSVCIGLATACDTLFSQTYGSGNLGLLGVQLQTTIFILGSALLVCVALHLNVETLLVLMGQDPVVAQMTGEYCLHFIPGMVCLFASLILNRFLVSQSIVWPQVVVYFVGISLHAVFQYVFLYVLELGLRGSAWAQCIAYFNNFFTTLCYCLYIKIFDKTWHGWSWRCLEGWGSFTKLAVAGMLMVCLEWWAFEILIIIAGLLGTTELGAQGVLFNWNSLMFAIPGGIGMTVAIRVGQELGAGRTLHAQTASRVGYTLTVFVTAVVFTLVISLRQYMPLVFTSDPEVIELSVKILPLLAVFKLFDDMTIVTRFGVRGMGRQTFGTVTIFLSYYLIGLPAGISMMFLTPLRSAALWVGNTVAMGICLITFIVYMNCWVDWTVVTTEARIRAGVLKKEPKKEAVAAAKVTEKTALLERSQDQTYTSFTQANHKQNPDALKPRRSPRKTSFMEDDGSRFEDKNYLIPLVVKRLLTLAVFVAILAVGILCHIFVDINDLDSYLVVTNSTNTSATTLLPTVSDTQGTLL